MYIRVVFLAGDLAFPGFALDFLCLPLKIHRTVKDDIPRHDGAAAGLDFACREAAARGLRARAPSSHSDDDRSSIHPS